MTQPGDIVKIKSNQTGHLFMIGEKVEVTKCIGFGSMQCKGERRSCIVHVDETSPVWDK